jgi:hypothetical protein
MKKKILLITLIGSFASVYASGNTLLGVLGLESIDLQEITTTEADLIIAEEFSSSMEISAKDLNAKFASISKKIKDLEPVTTYSFKSFNWGSQKANPSVEQVTIQKDHFSKFNVLKSAITTFGDLDSLVIGENIVPKYSPDYNMRFSISDTAYGVDREAQYTALGFNHQPLATINTCQVTQQHYCDGAGFSLTKVGNDNHCYDSGDYLRTNICQSIINHWGGAYSVTTGQDEVIVQDLNPTLNEYAQGFTTKESCLENYGIWKEVIEGDSIPSRCIYSQITLGALNYKSVDGLIFEYTETIRSSYVEIINLIDELP